MQRRTVEIPTSEGVACAYEVTPEGAGPRPAILFCMDGMGMRDALRRMADRLGAAGYHVLAPDFFHRVGREVHFDPKVVFGSPNGFAEVRKVIGALTAEQMMADVSVFLDALVSRPDVDATRIGAVGYCMGGRIAFLASSRFPERLRAVASIHGGGLVTTAPDSPHLGVERVKARLYFAGAKEDTSFTAENAQTLVDALDRAGTRYELEHYGARHGWAIDDTPVHDPAEAERHWRAILALFQAELGPEGRSVT